MTDQTKMQARIEALEAERDRLVYALSGFAPAVQALLNACEKAGVFDSLISDLFPDAKRRGVRRDQGFSAIDAARNDVRMWADVARAALKGEGE